MVLTATRSAYGNDGKNVEERRSNTMIEINILTVVALFFLDDDDDVKRRYLYTARVRAVISKIGTQSSAWVRIA